MANVAENPWKLIGGAVNLSLDLLWATVTWTRPVNGVTRELLCSQYPMVMFRSFGSKHGRFQARFQNDSDRDAAKLALLAALGNPAVASYRFYPMDIVGTGNVADITEVQIDAAVSIEEVLGEQGERLLSFGLVEVKAYTGGALT